MKCPFKKVIVTENHDESNVNIISKVTTGFGECYNKECPYYGCNEFGREWCRRVENG